MNLETKVQFLHGVGPKMAERLEKLGVETLTDLIYDFPRTYLDYTKISKIAEITSNKTQETNSNNQTIKAKVINITNRRTSRRRFTVTEAVVADATGSLKVVWFNQPYLEKMLKAGQEIVLNGKISFDPFSHQLQMESPNRANGPKIVPIYSETVGISSYYIAKLLVNVEAQIANIKEYIPEIIIEKYNLIGIKDAILNLHQPADAETLERAQQRMAFDELFLFSLQKQLSKRDILVHRAAEMIIDETFLRNFAESLPFKLTVAQKKSAWQIIKDLASDKPMNRLLNGDVGSGKTVVAAFAAAVVIKNGYRVALMAPTEILANQHYQTLSDVLRPHGISVGLVTAAENKIKIENKKSKVENPEILVGTHALLHLKDPIENLGMVIIDEQHRFGVNQRNKLLQVKNGLRPHFLSMTATPIPRTMSLVVFADLDVSVIDEMPADRKKVQTEIIEPADRAKSYEFIRREAKKGHLAFVICPLIEEKEIVKENLFEQERKTVTKEYEKLSKEIFPDLKIAMLHGKMKSKEKELIMTDFKAGNYDILVATSVVEVGIDIPNATVMLIEDAERFGLAQLHQFRGRVGRGDKQSYCLLFSSSNSEIAHQRLAFMETISSGFELAEKDLTLRGPGQMYGNEQSGFWDFRFADISDKMMIERATEAAKDVASGIEKYPRLLEKVGEAGKHLE